MATSTSKPRSLLDLPPELLNDIYELILFDGEIGDHICDPEKEAALETDSPEAIDNLLSLGINPERSDRPDKLIGEGLHHLSQPAISKVNRQIRTDVMPMYYGNVQFNFNMRRFAVTDVKGKRVKTWSPVDWWRSIGDTNLRSIRNMAIVCEPSSLRHGRKRFTLEYRHPEEGGRTVTVHLVDPEKNVYELNRPPLPSNAMYQPWEASGKFPTIFEYWRHKKAMREDEYEAKLAPLIETVKDSGLHVEVLEKILAFFEPANFEYLRDHSSLGDAQEVIKAVLTTREARTSHTYERLMDGREYRPPTGSFYTCI